MIKSIKNFEIKELIATGGMAAIYKAVQTSLDRVVAVKVLHGHLAQDPNFITRFEREAKAAANLKHENIVNIIDFGKEEEVYFIAMEYVDGRSLKDLITQIKVFSIEVILTIAIDVCKGLSHAHQKGVIHRDIKPANILIGYDGIVKIADFGLAQAQDLTSITVTGAIVGTPAYMSPEQAAGRKVDNRSDIFSLGIILYEMLTGEKPFPGENYSSVITRILTASPKRPIEMNPLVPLEMNQIVEKMMEKDPDKRYSDVDALHAEFESYARNAGVNVSQKYISTFLKEPEQYVKATMEKRKQEHFDRGVYFMNLGFEKIDDAISEFNKVIFLDPNYHQAREYLDKLKAKKEKLVKKPEVKPKPAVVEKKVESKKKVTVLPVAGVIIIVLITGFFLVRALLPKSGSIVPKPEYGALMLNTDPTGAKIFIDGNDIARATPARIESLNLGRHEVLFTLSGYKHFLDTVLVKPESVISVSARLEKERVVISGPEKFGAIFVRTHPPGASIKIDGRDTYEKTPRLIKKLAAGTYRITVEKSGYDPVSVTKEVAGGRVVTVNVQLTKKAGPGQYGYLKLTVNPWAKVYIDGRHIETTPIANPIKIEAGPHVVKLTNPNFKTWTETIQFLPNQTITRIVQLSPGEGYLRITVNPWADVYIDNDFVGMTPIPKAIALNPGKHTLRLVNSEFKTYEETITIVADEVLRKHVNLK